jgi:hypothetical protein
MIDYISKRQEFISTQMQRKLNNGISDLEDEEEEFMILCDIMDKLCTYRRNHECAIQGDEDYSPHVIAILPEELDEELQGIFSIVYNTKAL